MAEVEKKSFAALSGKGGHRRLMPSKLCVPSWGYLVTSVITVVQGWD